MNTTNAMILDWAREKGIIGRATALDQILKTVEELGELAGAVSKCDSAAQKDSIGDVYVTLVIVAEIMGLGELPEVDHLSAFTDKFASPKRWVVMIANLTGRISDAADDHALAPEKFDPEEYTLNTKDAVRNTQRCLRMLAEHLGFTLQECVDHAYGIISKRSGRMVDGVFIKEEAVSNV